MHCCAWLKSARQSSATQRWALQASPACIIFNIYQVDAILPLLPNKLLDSAAIKAAATTIAMHCQCMGKALHQFLLFLSVLARTSSPSHYSQFVSPPLFLLSSCSSAPASPTRQPQHLRGPCSQPRNARGTCCWHAHPRWCPRNCHLPTAVQPLQQHPDARAHPLAPECCRRPKWTAGKACAHFSLVRVPGHWMNQWMWWWWW